MTRVAQMGRLDLGMGGYGAIMLALVAMAGVTATAQTRPRVNVSKSIINLPVIPQGNYLDPGPGPPIRPDVSIGRGPNNDYVFPPDLTGGYGSGPPGDPTVNGQWSPLDGDTPSF